MSKRAFKIHTEKAKPFKLSGRTKWKSIFWTGLIAAALLGMMALGLFQGKGQLSARTEVNRGARALGSGDPKEAERLARAVLGKDKESEEAFLLLAMALSRQDRYGEAIEAFREAIRLGRENPSSHLGLGEAMEGANRRGEAVVEYRRSIVLDSTFAMGHYRLGMALAGENYRAEAVKELERFLRLSPQAPEKAQVDSMLARLKQP